jgi:hypothetical protein
MQNLTPAELRTLRNLNTPAKIQRFLDSLAYNDTDTCHSPRTVLRTRRAHCLEGALLAAAAMRVNGKPALLFDLEAVNDTDHVLTLFREGGAWGSIGLSNFSGLRYRAPIYRSLRELALSYFDDYVNFRRERTLRNFSRPVDMRRFDHLGWMTGEGNVWYVAEYLCEIPHTPLLTKKMEASLTRVDSRRMKAAMTGMRKTVRS